MHIKQKLQSQIGDDIQHIFDREDLFKEALRYIEELEINSKQALETLNLADDALHEAEAILGGEYGDQYGPLCETMIKLRDNLAEIKSPFKNTIEEGNITVGEMK
jgi:hypothetical protein